MNPFSSGARVFIFTPMLSKPRPRVLGAAVAEAVAAARCSSPEATLLHCNRQGNVPVWAGVRAAY